MSNSTSNTCSHCSSLWFRPGPSHLSPVEGRERKWTTNGERGVYDALSPSLHASFSAVVSFCFSLSYLYFMFSRCHQWQLLRFTHFVQQPFLFHTDPFSVELTQSLGLIHVLPCYCDLNRALRTGYGVEDLKMELSIGIY